MVITQLRAALIIGAVMRGFEHGYVEPQVLPGGDLQPVGLHCQQGGIAFATVRKRGLQLPNSFAQVALGLCGCRFRPEQAGELLAVRGRRAANQKIAKEFLHFAGIEST